MLFPSPYMWKMVKDDANKIPENMIGLAYTPRKIHEDSYIPILPAVLITLTKYGQTLLESGFTDDRS